MGLFTAASTQYYACTQGPNLDLLSFGCWFRFLTASDKGALITVHAPPFWLFDVDIYNGAIEMSNSWASSTIIASSLSINTWYWVCFSSRGSTCIGYCTLADGGKLVNSATVDPETDGRVSDGMEIGAYKPAGEHPYNGDLVNFKLWSGVALSAAQLQAEQYSFAPLHSPAHIWACKPLVNVRRPMESQFENPNRVRASWTVGGGGFTGGAFPRGLDIGTRFPKSQRPLRGAVAAVAPTTYPAALLMQL